MKKILIIMLFSLISFSCAQKKQPENKSEITKSNEIVSKQITMIELGSVNCIPCKAMEKVMDSLEIIFPKKLKIVFHDVWTEQGKPYSQKYNIRAIPTQIFQDSDGKEIHRHEGFYPQAEIVAFLKSKGLKAQK